jgi:hypothetical protein
MRHLSLDVMSTITQPVTSATADVPATSAPTESDRPAYVEGASNGGAQAQVAPSVPATVPTTIIVSDITARLRLLGIYTHKLVPGIAHGTAGELPPYLEPPAEETARLMSSSVPPDERWYIVIRGFNPGVYQGW